MSTKIFVVKILQMFIAVQIKLILTMKISRSFFEQHSLIITKSFIGKHFLIENLVVFFDKTEKFSLLFSKSMF